MSRERDKEKDGRVESMKRQTRQMDGGTERERVSDGGTEREREECKFA